MIAKPPHPLDNAAAWLAARRSTVAVLVPLVGAGGFILERLLSRVEWVADAHPSLGVVAAALHAASRFPPLLVAANVAMALPLALGLRRAWDRRALAGIVLLALWSYLIEGVGVRTGWPYGPFQYAMGLEPLLLGIVPLALPLFWLPMILSSRLLADRFLTRIRVGSSDATMDRPPAPAWALLLLSTLILVLLDGVLDPPAVGVGFWAYAAGGAYYGVPLSNFLGWCFSGLVAHGLLLATLPEDRLRAARPDAGSFDSLRAFLLFWGLVAAALGQAIPALLALAVASLERSLARSRQFDH